MQNLFCCPICKNDLAESFACEYCGEQYLRQGNMYDFRIRALAWSEERRKELVGLLYAYKNSEWLNKISHIMSLDAYVNILADPHVREIDEYIMKLSHRGVDVGHRYDTMYVPQGDARDLHIATAMRRVPATKKKGVVLDLGCGTLRASRELVRAGYENIIALDLVSDVMAYGYGKLRGEDKKKIILVRADARFLPFKSSAVDCVFSFELFEHIDTPDMFLLDIQRILADDGLAIMNTWNALEIRNRSVIRQKGKSYYENGFFYTFYQPRELRVLLDRAGLDASIRPHGFYLERRILQLLENKCAGFLACADNIASYIFPPFLFHCLMFCIKKKNVRVS